MLLITRNRILYCILAVVAYILICWLINTEVPSLVRLVAEVGGALASLLLVIVTK